MSSSRWAKFALLSAWLLKKTLLNPWDQQDTPPTKASGLLWQHLDFTKHLLFKEFKRDLSHPRRNEQGLEVGVLRNEHRERSCKTLISNIHSGSHHSRSCFLVANNAHFFSALWGQEQIEDTPKTCEGTGKRRKAPWSCSKSGNLRADLQILIKLPRNSLLLEDFLLWTILLFLLWEKQENPAKNSVWPQHCWGRNCTFQNLGIPWELWALLGWV